MKFPLSAARLWALRVALCASAYAALATTSQAQTTPEVEKINNSAMSGELLYEILLGELNLRQGEPAAGFALLLDAARKTNDVQLYARAVDVALQARSGDGALMAARAWSQAAPQDRKANGHLLQILIALNQVTDSLGPLKKELSFTPESERNAVISQIPRQYARVSDKKQAADIVQQALEPYLRNSATASEAWTSVGRMRLAQDNTAAALDAARQGSAADGNALSPALLALELMGRQIKEAEPLVMQALRRQNTPELAMSYVRVLIEMQRYDSANEQLQTITQKFPQHADAWLVLGSLQFEQGQDALAERSLSRYVELAATVNNDNTARGIAQAQTRRASLLARQGKLGEARQLLAQLPARNADEQRSRLLAEVQLLREHRQWQIAYDLLADASANDVDLLYEQAMLAEKLNRLDDMEKLLRNVMQLDPSYHNAYNALGFSLADRNLRLDEAKQLIIKALTFVPDDPFITDSLGWVEFRLGNTSAALTYLQKAYKDRTDPEIAAHLGEVLWHLQRTDDARKVWREALDVAPNNETLQETLQRLKPAL
ncbi:tetratricopeptide repeat protein [Limnohabitans sp.]|uniref:tetratricopeptide repeat protein n=1 Tax=Limnohabitans sp. TaxID=1907725 RepID=UPI00286F95F8|nr:tetratricopeptide repeat protein [Limnohabitans sp.]